MAGGSGKAAAAAPAEDWIPFSLTPGTEEGHEKDRILRSAQLNSSLDSHENRSSKLQGSLTSSVRSIQITQPQELTSTGTFGDNRDQETQQAKETEREKG